MLHSLHTAVAISCLSLSSISVANPVLDAVFPERAAGASSGECADFSGNWSGNCVITGSYETTIADVTKVNQVGCEVVSKGGNLLPLGGITTTSTTLPGGETMPGSASAYSITADWNADKSAIHSTLTFSSRSLSGKSFDIHFRGQGELKLVDGQLVESFKATEGADVSVVCTYDKQ